MEREITTLEWLLMLTVVMLILPYFPFDFKGMPNKTQRDDKTECRKCSHQRFTDRRRFMRKKHTYAKKTKSVPK